MLYFLTGGAERATESLQETFTKCWRRRHSVIGRPDALGESELKAWIFRIALTTARDLRHAAKHRLSVIDEAEIAWLTDRMSPPSDSQTRRRLARTRWAFSHLASHEREIFLLRQNADMSYEDIAQALDLSVSAVKARSRMALAKILKALEPKQE